MSLIPCPACGGEVSDAAVACPKCGHPLHPPQQGEAREVTRAMHLLAVFGLLGGLGCLVGAIYEASTAVGIEGPGPAPTGLLIGCVACFAVGAIFWWLGAKAPR